MTSFPFISGGEVEVLCLAQRLNAFTKLKSGLWPSSEILARE